MLFTIAAVLFVLVCFLLGLFILVQSDKGGGISGAIGGGMSQANTVLGAQNTENILTRGTTILVILFFALSIMISFVLVRFSSPEAEAQKSIIRQSVEEQKTLPATSAQEMAPVAPVENLQPVAPAATAEEGAPAAKPAVTEKPAPEAPKKN